jgi:hypothetical protein
MANWSLGGKISRVKGSSLFLDRRNPSTKNKKHFYPCPSKMKCPLISNSGTKEIKKKL